MGLRLGQALVQQAPDFKHRPTDLASAYEARVLSAEKGLYHHQNDVDARQKMPE